MKPLSDDVDWDLVAQAREPHPERLHLVEDERRARRKAADAAYYQANKERIDRRNKAWREANKEEMRRYDKAYAASHREERREAARRWQARFKAEHGVSYSAWRRRRLRETDPQTAASTPQTAAPARNTGENVDILPTAKAGGFPSRTGLQRNFRPVGKGLTLHRAANAALHVLGGAPARFR